jgi:hypothetical protein
LLGSKLEAAVPLAGGRRHGLDGPPLAAAREGGRHLSPTADGVTARSARQLWWAQRLRAATVRRSDRARAVILRAQKRWAARSATGPRTTATTRARAPAPPGRAAAGTGGRAPRRGAATTAGSRATCRATASSARPTKRSSGTGARRWLPARRPRTSPPLLAEAAEAEAEVAAAAAAGAEQGRLLAAAAGSPAAASASCRPAPVLALLALQAVVPPAPPVPRKPRRLMQRQLARGSATAAALDFGAAPQ